MTAGRLVPLVLVGALALAGCAPDSIIRPVAPAPATSVLATVTQYAQVAVSNGTFTESEVFGLNDPGQMVGRARTTTSVHAAIWDSLRADPRILALPAGASSSVALDISNNGVYIVGSNYTTSGVFQPVRWLNGVPRILPLPRGYVSGTALAVNNAGSVVGWVATASGHLDAALWNSKSRITLLPDFEDRATYAYDINEAGTIVGVGEPAGSPFGQRAMVWRNGRPTSLGSLSGGSGSVAAAINNKDQVAGYGYDLGGTASYPTVWVTSAGAGYTITDFGAGVAQGITDGLRVAGSTGAQIFTKLDQGPAQLLPMQRVPYTANVQGVNRCGVIVATLGWQTINESTMWIPATCDP